MNVLKFYTDGRERYFCNTVAVDLLVSDVRDHDKSL